MTNVQAIKDALKNGAEPKMICQTCPWDRFCISPPTMTSGDVQAELDKAKGTDENGKDEDVMGSIIMSMLFFGRDTSCTCCPVLVNRMHSSEGKKIVDTVRDMMKTWED